MKKYILAIFLATSLVATSVGAVEVSLEQKLSGLYVSFFNRAADEAGLTYWNTLGETAKANGESVSDVLKQLSAGFASHPTFTSTYSSMSNGDFVKAIYQNSLGRAGDAEGVAYWSELINNGKSRSDMVAEFIEMSLTLDLTTENFPTLTYSELSAAVERQQLITNKVEVAVYFTKNLGTLSNVADTDNLENDPAYLASIEVISGVTVDSSTVSFIENKIATTGMATDLWSDFENFNTEIKNAKTEKLQRIQENNPEFYSYITGTAIIETRLPDNTNVPDVLASRLAYYLYTKVYEPELDLKVDLYFDELRGIEVTQNKISNFSKKYLNIGGLVTEISIYLTDAVVGGDDLKRETKERVINAITSSGQSELYGFAFAGHETTLEAIEIIDNCLSVSIPWEASISEAVTKAAGNAALVINCAMGTTVAATGRFVNSYNGYITLQEYEYFKIAKIYLDAYFSCGKLNNTCMASQFNGKSIQSEQLQYIMEEYQLDTGWDWSVRQGANNIIDDYIRLIIDLTNDITSLVPSDSGDNIAELNYQKNLISGEISDYGGHIGAKYIRITPPEEVSNGYDGIMCEINAEDKFGNDCVLLSGSDVANYTSSDGYEISLFKSVNESWRGSVDTFIGGNKFAISNFADISLDFSNNVENVTLNYNPNWSGTVIFLDNNNNQLPIPTNAKIRITPEVEQIENNWRGFVVDINSQGYWVTSPMNIDPSHYTSSNTYQFAMFDDANDDNMWMLPEIAYGGFMNNNPSTAVLSDFNGQTITIGGSTEVEPIILGLSPTLVNADVQNTFTVTGNNLPNTISMSLHGASCGKPYAVSSTSARIDCTPQSTGSTQFYVAPSTGMPAISGASSLYVIVL